MLNNWNKYVDNTVLHTYNDDRTYMYILYLNGYIAKPSSKYSEKELNAYYDLHLDDTSMKHARMYPIGRNTTMVGNANSSAQSNVIIKCFLHSNNESLIFFIMEFI